MPGTVEHGAVTVALLGNPNTGKSTLFNALSGVRQRVGNYPGVTVEKKTGQVEIAGRRFLLIDLPGTYSLAPRSPDEMVAVDVLLGRQADVPPPDVLVCIVDASNLERHLYLVSQALELGRPTVIALNMVDVAADRGIGVDVERLRQRLRLPVIPLQAHRGVGLAELQQTLLAVAQLTGDSVPATASPFPAVFQDEVQQLDDELREKAPPGLPRFLVERLLLDSGGYLESAGLPGVDGATLARIRAARERLAATGHAVPTVEAEARYAWVVQVLDGVVQQPAQRKATWTDRLDCVLMHKVWGTLIFAVVLAVVFQAIFRWAHPFQDAIDHAVVRLGRVLQQALPDGALRSLLVDGVVTGVGGVLAFLPQIFILFLFIGLLEECGYMARAAYLADRLMSRIGLSGKSFIPLLSSFACAVPAIMAARTIEDRRDRLVTILVAPLMSCSARVPVYTLFIAAFVPDVTWFGNWVGLQGVTMFAMYLLGVGAAVVVSRVLKRTLLHGQTPPFILELPSYKLPSLRTVALRMLERGWAFVGQAGTLILAVSIVVWAAAYFPRPAADAGGPALSPAVAEIAATNLERSYLGQAGKLIAPVVRPLGWDWRIGCAVIASFPAREVVVGSLGVVYRLGKQDVHSETLKETLRSATWPGSDRPVFNTPVALSIMVFYALCAQCAATLAVIRRETNSWRWPAFTFVYMTALAYIGALLTYQVGMRCCGPA
jgi:ferrous iron transport protein B